MHLAAPTGAGLPVDGLVRPGVTVWFTPEIARQRFALAHSSRTTGLQELHDLGLVTSKVAVTSEDGTYLTFQRRRNVHQLNLGVDSPATPWRSEAHSRSSFR